MNGSFLLVFISGTMIVLALAVGLLKPWRGLLFIWTIGLVNGIASQNIYVEIFHTTLIIIIGAVFLAPVEIIINVKRNKSGKTIVPGKDLMLGSMAVLILGGIFLGPVLGFILGGATGAAGTYCLKQKKFFKIFALELFLYVLRVVVLILPAALICMRVFGLF